MPQHLTINAMVVGSIPIRGKDFFFSQPIREVRCILPFNMQKESLAENGQWSVLRFSFYSAVFEIQLEAEKYTITVS